MAIETEFNNGKLVITVDVTEAEIAKAYPSSTGKTRIVATTGGFTSLTDRISFSLTVNVRPPRKD